MKWDKETQENWNMKMENAGIGIRLLSEEETERINAEHPLPTEEDIKKIMDEYHK